MYELNWDLHPDMVRIETLGDGSCFFHAILQCVFDRYKNSPATEKITMVDAFRAQLSDLLDQYYPDLSRGHLAEFSSVVPEYSLQSMKAILKNRFPVDNAYNEFVSNLLGLDIYILDLEKKKPYITGNDADILFKGRKSIIILYLPGHYESVGVKTVPLPNDTLGPNDCRVQTIFEPDHPLISKIRFLNKPVSE
jgi:hypothetical protein